MLSGEAGAPGWVDLNGMSSGCLSCRDTVSGLRLGVILTLEYLRFGYGTSYRVETYRRGKVCLPGDGMLLVLALS